MKPELENLIISQDKSLYVALEQLNIAATGTLFVVDSRGKISGVLTDGDIRRALLRNVRLEDKVAVAMNRSFVAVRQGEVTEDFLGQLDERINYLPIVNDYGEIVDYHSFFYRRRIPLARPHLNGNEAKYVNECIDTNWISSQGKFVEEFEEKFATFCGVKHGIATCNGTTALHLALAAKGIGEGDEVIVPSFTFIATANAVTYAGAKPVFVDVSMDTWGMDPEAVGSALTPHTRAIIPVHLYGRPVDMDPIMALAEANDLFVLEDAAEAHGARYRGRPVGGIGHAGCFSFFANKIITTGEGGMVVTDDKGLAENCRILRDHGMDPQKKYWHARIGFNYRMTNLQAAIGCAQLERIGRLLKNRERVYREYRERLEAVPAVDLPRENEWSESVNWVFCILINEAEAKRTRDEVMALLEERNIEVRPFFYPVHQMPPYFRGDGQPVLENTESLSRSGISLPLYPEISIKEIDRVCRNLRDILV
jgi:perosamine synthetase